MESPNQQQTENYEHLLYKHIKDIQEADAVAFAFVNKDTSVNFPYKAPELGAKELRANVLYSGICQSDSTHVRSKFYPVLYPIAAGHEIIAEVSEVGQEVTNFKIGDKVAFGALREACGNCKLCEVGKETLCRNVQHKTTFGYYWGGFSTQIQQPADFFIPVPEGMDLSRAAPLLCAGVTVYTPIKKYLQKGDNAAVVGVGGLGHLAVKFISKMGHKVTGVTTTLSKKDFILSMGASDVLDSTDLESVRAHESKYDFVISTAPTCDNFNSTLSLVAPGGILVIVGVGDIASLTKVNLSDIVIEEKRIVGSLVGSRETIKEMLNFCVSNDVYPMVESFSFEEFATAFDKLENGKPHFRCVVNCEDYARKNNLFK